MEGYSYFPDIAFSSVVPLDSEAQRVASLSEREVIVLQHFAKGMNNIEIGQALFLSNKTISTHKARMLAKLGLNSVVEMVDLAKRMGLI
jgi:two-component system response regulator EvgA